jgi:diguanylate cyclase (GGDEF)-like protein
MTRADNAGLSGSVLLIDLDRFKPVNDAHGHTAGDMVLCAVATRLEHLVRRGDLVARLGGDEFAIINENRRGSPTEGAGNLAARVIAAVQKPITVGDVTIEIGCSIGIAQIPADGITGEEVLHAADIAMYRAKRDGRDRYRFFEAKMDVEQREQTALEADLRRAVARNEIVPYYQPLMSLTEKRLLGFEILARWDHPERGFVPPDVFIPLAEKLGLISELTFNLLRASCLDAKAWPSDISLSLNISPTQLGDHVLPLQLLSILNETDFQPGRLEIEITENALVSDLESAKAILTSFQNLGMKVALDDFGTGYSSLHHLRELHFDKLKIDRSFVQSMRSNPESAKIVNAILGLAKSLGLPTTAEGIENADVLADVTGGGAEFGQGYFFGKAVPAAEVGAVIARNGQPSRRHAG